MGEAYYHLSVGDYDCLVIKDGGRTGKLHRLFVNAPDQELKTVLQDHNIQTDEHPHTWSCLLVDTGSHRVLVDTGGGAGNFRTAGFLCQNLRDAGIQPDDIDTVILSHGHPDHIGGCTDKNGMPIYANARHFIWQAEWDYWTSDTNLAAMSDFMGGFARKNLPPLKGQLELIDQEAEILPGIFAIQASGHTPGHMALKIVSKGEVLFCLADVFLHPIHLERPDWYSAVEKAPEQAVATRYRLLEQISAERALVHLFHFDFPGVGYVRKEGKGWRWS